jgi:hypothetical protein
MRWADAALVGRYVEGAIGIGDKGEAVGALHHISETQQRGRAMMPISTNSSILACMGVPKRAQHVQRFSPPNTSGRPDHSSR